MIDVGIMLNFEFVAKRFKYKVCTWILNSSQKESKTMKVILTHMLYWELSIRKVGWY